MGTQLCYVRMNSTMVPHLDLCSVRILENLSNYKFKGLALKSTDITLPTKVCLVKAMVFPVVMYGCESWTIKKTECWSTDVFELWCWRRFLRVLWTAVRSNQSIQKEISPEYSLEGLMLKLKLQHFGHLMQRTDTFEKTDAGKDWRREEMVGWHHQLNGHEFEKALGVGDGQESLVCCSPQGRRVGHNWVTELNWIKQL